MAKPWEQVGVITGVISLLVAIITLVSSIFLPEIRCYFKLSLNDCSLNPMPPQESVIKTYFIEIFFLQNQDRLQKEATDIQNALIDKGFDSGKVTLKPVSEATLHTLETPKYDEIRFDVGSEELPAAELKQLLQEIIPDKTFNLRDANNPEPTQGYISIFLWP